MFARHLLVVAGMALVLVAGSAFAQGTYPEVQQGDANGAITPRQGARLQAPQH